MEIRFLVGTADEPVDKLGIAHLVELTLDKGTEIHDGCGLADAFDEIGAGHGGWCGRETSGFDSLCLPEFFERNVELHAEFLRRPTFPAESCEVAVELARQELLALEDDPQSLADKLISLQAYGPILGRHTAGESKTLETITRDDFVAFWRERYHTGRMQVSVAGPLEAGAVAATIERYFSGFGSSARSGRQGFDVRFDALAKHHKKETEQQQIIMAFRGVPKNHPDSAAERILISVLSDGMSSRLFTEVREKQGLVYWVGAWNEHPRNAGMVFVGASTTPERCEKTHATLLRELDRVHKDVTEQEIERALAGITVRADIRSDLTRSRCSEQGDDLIHHGKPVASEEKIAKLRAVTVDDVKRYCHRYGPQQGLSAVTLGPRSLDANGD